MTINIEYETEKKLDLDYETIIRQVVEKAMDYEKCPYEAEVNVTLTDNAAIHQPRIPRNRPRNGCVIISDD